MAHVNKFFVPHAKQKCYWDRNRMTPKSDIIIDNDVAPAPNINERKNFLLVVATVDTAINKSSINLIITISSVRSSRKVGKIQNELVQLPV